MSSCCFCSSLVHGESREFWNSPLFASPNFVALPSLGSLVEGWVVIVPRKHFICTGAVPAQLVPEMDRFKSDVCTVLAARYGELRVFEHGPSAALHKIGCGVDHAHVHI